LDDNTRTAEILVLVKVRYFKDEDGKVYIHNVETPGERTCVIAIQEQVDD